MAGASLEAQVSIVALVDPPAMGGSEASLGPFELDSRSKLLDLTLQGRDF